MKDEEATSHYSLEDLRQDLKKYVSDAEVTEQDLDLMVEFLVLVDMKVDIMYGDKNNKIQNMIIAVIRHPRLWKLNYMDPSRGFKVSPTPLLKRLVQKYKPVLVAAKLARELEAHGYD